MKIRKIVYFEYLYNNSKEANKLVVFGKGMILFSRSLYHKNVYDKSQTSLQIQSVDVYEEINTVQ